MIPHSKFISFFIELTSMINFALETRVHGDLWLLVPSCLTVWAPWNSPRVHSWSAALLLCDLCWVLIDWSEIFSQVMRETRQSRHNFSRNLFSLVELVVAAVSRRSRTEDYQNTKMKTWPDEAELQGLWRKYGEMFCIIVLSHVSIQSFVIERFI